MNWRQIYCDIIKNAKFKEKERKLKRKNKEEYYEKHHILPNAIYPQYNKNKRNLVLLTAREHWICHKIAVRIWPGRSMLYALWFLAHDRQNNYCKINSKKYESLQKEYSILHSQMLKDKWANKEFKEKMLKLYKTSEYREMMWKRFWNSKFENQYHLGQKHSEEIRKKISENRGSYSAWNKGLSGWWTEKVYEANKNKQLSEETRKKMGIKPEGFEVWNKGKEWSDKTKQKMSESAKKRLEDPEERKKQNKVGGKNWYNNGIKNGFYFECPEGWIKGRLKIKSKEKFWFTDGKKNKFKVKCPEGWWLGKTEISLKRNSDLVECLETGEVKELWKWVEHYPNVKLVCKGLRKTSNKKHFKFVGV